MKRLLLGDRPRPINTVAVPFQGITINAKAAVAESIKGYDESLFDQVFAMIEPYGLGVNSTEP